MMKFTLQKIAVSFIIIIFLFEKIGSYLYWVYISDTYHVVTRKQFLFFESTSLQV